MTTSPGRVHDNPTPPQARPSRRLRHAVRFVTAGLFTVVVAVLVLPDLLFGLDGRSPFVQLVSFRPWVLVGEAGVLAVLLGVLWFERRAWPFVAGALAVVLIGGALVLPRVIADPVPTAGTPFTVLSFNTYEGRGDVAQLAALIRDERPDVVSVMESGDRFRSRLAPLVEPMGYRLHTSIPPGRADVAGVTAVVAGALGDVHVRVGDGTSAFPYLELTGGGLGTLHVVAFHSVAPVPGSVPRWRSDMALLAKWCAGPTPAVVAGDFNATLDHSALRAGMAGCADAADQRGAGLVPTWGPTDRTRAVGPQIDHVLATDPIAAETFTVHDIAGSDHRAIVARLRIP